MEWITANATIPASDIEITGVVGQQHDRKRLLLAFRTFVLNVRLVPSTDVEKTDFSLARGLPE